MSEADESNQSGSAQTDDGENNNQQEAADSTDWKAEARKWEQRAKDNSGVAKAAEKARLAAMSEAERAVAEAEARGRSSATVDFGKELAQSQFDAAAGRRNADFDTAKVLRRLDLATLLDEDGRPDPKAITDAVNDLIPAGGTPSYDGGARTSSTRPKGMNQIIRDAAGVR